MMNQNVADDTAKGASKIHCMKYDLEPNYIKALNLSASDRKLAVLRFDHSIEIWNLNYTPVIEQVIYNVTLSELETVAWFERRLFATTLSGHLLEYDLQKSTIKYKEILTAGPAWCLDFHRETALVAVGTDKGYINLFKVEENRLSFVKLFDKQAGPILSLKFDKEGKRIVSGGINALRTWNIESGHVINLINNSHLAPKNETHHWSLCVCSDFTIVAGDSHGYLTEWDGETCLQLAKHKTHAADITVLLMNEAENQLYCAGVDPTIVTFSRIEVNASTRRKNWVKSYQRLVHDRDVRGLALLGDKLYSGGYEACLTCSYGPPQTIHHYPIMFNTTNSLTATENGTFLLFKYSNFLEFWTMPTNGTFYTKIHSVKSKSDEVIINATISPNGSWMTYATVSHFRLFSVQYDENKTAVTLCRKGDLPDICTSYKQACFTPDNKFLIIAPFKSTNPVAISLMAGDCFGQCQELLIDKKVQDDYITFLKVTACSQYLVVVTRNCLVFVFRLYPQLELYDILPKYSLANVLITAVAIQPKTNNILIAHSNHKIIEYSIANKQFTKFCEHSSPETLTMNNFNVTHPILDIVFHPKASNNFFFYNDSSICIVEKNKIEQSKKANNNKKIKLAENIPVFNVLNKYKHLIHFNYLTNNEFILLEIQPFELLKKLEKPYRKNQFGTK